jgi:TRAP-type mannitol/chloroaromatic compound transport system substrate-binding protein
LQKRKEELMGRCTCTKKDAAAILAAAEIMYKKKYNKLPSKSTCTKQHAELILDAAKMMYQKKYNKFSKSDVYKLREEIDDDFEDFYDDLLDQIYDVNDLTYSDDNFEDEVVEWMNYCENTLRFT